MRRFLLLLIILFHFGAYSQTAPVALISNAGSDTICEGSSVNLLGNALNGPISDWAWVCNPSQGVVILPDTFQQNVSISFQTPGTYTIQLFVTNASSTDDTFRIIEVKPFIQPSVTLSSFQTNPICVGDSMNFFCSSLNQGSSPSYSWFLNQSQLSSIDTFVTINALQNNDSVFIRLISSSLCALPSVVSDTFVVQANPLIIPSVSIVQIPVAPCEGDSVRFEALVNNAGSNPNYQWSINGINFGVDTNLISPGLLNSSDEITIVLIPDTSCLAVLTDNDTLSPVFLPKPNLNVIQGIDTVCPTDSAVFIVSALAGSNFSWLPVGGLSSLNNDTVKVAQANEGIYTYQVIANLNNCLDSANLELYVINQLPITVSENDTICDGDSVLLVVSGGGNYNWVSSEIINCTTCDSIYVSPSSTSQFSVNVSNGGCSATDSVTVFVDQPVSASFNSTELEFDNAVTYSFENLSQNATNFVWSFGDGSDSVSVFDTTHTYLSSGTYPVTLIAYSENACPNDTAIQILELKIESKIEAPNVFSPNGDDINETFFFITKGITKLSCTIYDRWGIEIANLPKPSSKWDGRTDSGLMVMEGTYFYVVKATGFDNKEYSLKGFVQLVK